MKRVALISTGGTIEKTYDPLEGVLVNGVAVLDVMLAQLDLEGVRLSRIALMNKDSLDMTPADHCAIANAAVDALDRHDGVVVVHGTDRVTRSGHEVLVSHGEPKGPIVFTGAMRPYVMRTTDSMQNLTEALLAVQLAPRGVYLAMHNKLHRFPGLYKDRDEGTYRRASPPRGALDSALADEDALRRVDGEVRAYLVERALSDRDHPASRATLAALAHGGLTEDKLDLPVIRAFVRQ